MGVGSDGGQRAEEVRHRTSAEAVPEDHLEGIRFRPLGCVGWRRFLHRRGAYLARFSHLLRPILPPARDPGREPGGITRHPTEEWMMQMGRDAADDACTRKKQLPPE
jgi:hypothetical protein